MPRAPQPSAIDASVFPEPGREQQGIRREILKNLSAHITAITLFAALAIPSQSSAQQPRYKLIDLGTLGGPQSYVNIPDFGCTRVLNNHGAVVGWADTPAPDPFPAFCFNDDCFVSHAFEWQNGNRTDLGALVDGLSGQANWISGGALDAGVQHAFLLIPTEENDAAENDAATQGKGADVTKNSTRTRDFRIPGRRTPDD